MEKYHTLNTEITEQLATVWLARPEVHNALNATMIREISTFFAQIEENSDVRIVIIRGLGKSFCSGADLAWMKKSFTLNDEENLEESKALSNMFNLIFNCSKVVIGAIHGNVFGGGVGIVAACDLAYCVDDSKFSLSETRIGMAAASITPYLLQKIHPSDLKELIFTAKVFGGNEAEKYKIINQSFTNQGNMDIYLNSLIKNILSNGKLAIAASKQLINQLTEKAVTEKVDRIPELLARIRVSAEAQEGFSAFLEKRKPQW